MRPSCDPALLAQPTSFPCLLPAAARRTPGVCSPRAHHLHPAWLPPRRSGPPLQRHTAPDLSRTLPRPRPLLCHPLSHAPNAVIAAVRRCRGHRLPLVPPSCPRAPPRLPRPLRQATRRRTPCGATIAIVFLLGRRRPPTPIHRLQCVPEPASTPAATAVSSATVSLSSPPRSRAVTPFPTTAEPPPSPSSPSTQLR